MTDEREPTEADYPGVESAQAFVIPSYQWMVTRLEAADSRAQALMTIAATVTLAVPAIGKAVRSDVSFGSGWFLTAMMVAVLVEVIGVIVRARGAVMLPDPAVLYGRWLRKSTWQFQKDALYFAGQHFATNRRLVGQKAAAIIFMTGLFTGELLLLLLWLTRK